MSEYQMKPGKLGEKILNGYQKVEDAVVGGYQKIEGSVVGGYKKIENAFVDAFLEKAEAASPGTDSASREKAAEGMQ